MSHSEAWAEIQPMVTTPINYKSQSNDALVVQTIMDMLDVARIQTEISYSMIPFFFSRINSILDHLVREGEIKSNKQSLYFRIKAMEKLNIAKIDKHIELLNLFKKKPILKDRFDSSIQPIIESMSQGTSFQEASREQWIKKDKKYFDKDITNFNEYTQLMKSYSIQKYGKMPSEK